MIKVLGAWLLALTAIQAPALPTGKIESLEFFLAIQNGRPPESAAAIQGAATKALASLKLFSPQLSFARRTSTTANCTRFRDVALALSQDLVKGITSYSGGDFELGNRLQIEIASFLTIQYLLSSKAEGGFGVLDVHERLVCPFVQRDTLMEQADQTLNDLTAFFRASFGTPGLAAMEDSQRRLLQLALQDEKVERRNFWIYTGALTVASIALWEFAPAALLLGVRGIWGVTPRILTLPSVTFGIQATALTAEGFVFAYAEELAADHPQAPKIMLGSWTEFMNAIETIVASPVHAPQLQMVLLSRVHAMVYADVLPWIVARAPEMNAEEVRYGSLTEALRHYREREEKERR